MLGKKNSLPTDGTRFDAASAVSEHLTDYLGVRGMNLNEEAIVSRLSGVLLIDACEFLLIDCRGVIYHMLLTPSPTSILAVRRPH